MTKVKRQNIESKAVKKVSWKPANKLAGFTVPEGYRARWCSDTPENISRKKAEGWEILDTTKFPGLKDSEFSKGVSDSEGLSKTFLKRNELVAMIIPEELAEQRNEYYRQETENQTQRALGNEEVKKLVSKLTRNPKNVQSYNPQGVSVID